MPVRTSHRGAVAGPVTAELLEDRRLLSAVVALAENNMLRTVDSDNPSTVLATKRVTGLGRGEKLVGIDVRPATGELFGLTDDDQVFRIDPVTGRATAAGDPFEADVAEAALFGFDFNPAVDRLRVVDSLGANYRLNPNTGAFVDADAVTAGVQADASLAYAADDVSTGLAPQVTGAAYTNNVAGAPGGTTLYAIDVAQNALVMVGSALGTPDSPNGGVLRTVGQLGIDVVGATGFDILSVDGTDTAYAALKVDGRGARTQLYTIDLTTGAATAVGRLANGATVLGIAAVPASQEMVALTAGNRLVSFQIARPDLVTTTRVTGLARGERLVGIDTRPANGVLYALGKTSRLYTVDATTGVAAQVGEAFAVPLAGTNFGFDFNPTVDRIRVTSDSGQNLRLNPDTGAVADADPTTEGIQTDGDIAAAGQTPVVPHVAYTENVAGATTTTLYGIDTDAGTLVTIGTAAGAAEPVSPNTGTVFSVGPLGTSINRGEGAFDIVTTTPGTNLAFAALRESGTRGSTLHSIDLTTGDATLIGQVGRRLTVLGLAAI